MLKHVLTAVLTTLTLASVSYADVAEPPAPTPTVRTIRLGVMRFRGQNGFTTHIKDEDRLLAQVPQWIASHVPGIQLETRYYRMNDLMRAIEAKKVDVFLGSSGLFWQMKHTGARDLATIVSAQTPDPNEGVAGVIFVRKDRTDLNTLSDLKGKTAWTICSLPPNSLWPRLPRPVTTPAIFSHSAIITIFRCLERYSTY